METVEAAVYPTLDRLLADRQTTAPMAREHVEIRRLVAAIGAFADDPQAHGGGGPRKSPRPRGGCTAVAGPSYARRSPLRRPTEREVDRPDD